MNQKSHRVRRVRPWLSTDRTGGVVDDVFDLVRASFPQVVIERLAVEHPADDDNLYFLGGKPCPGGVPDMHDRVHVYTAQRGESPFGVDDGEYHAFSTSDPDQVLATVCAWLPEVFEYTRD
jgi:hypothetical protein